MRFFLLFFLSTLTLFANFIQLHSFSANFTQTITDEQNKKLIYTGSLQAKEPQSALWLYKTPIKKSIYIKDNRVIVIEPELEQAIIKHIPANFDFFHMIKNAKQINKDTYITTLEGNTYTISVKNGLIVALDYKDDFGNSIHIVFSHQSQNKPINDTLFQAIIPSEYDILQN